MFEMIFEIASIACLSVLFVIAEPMILIKRNMGFKEENIGSLKIKDIFTKLLYCSLCSGFWIGLIYTHNIFMACIISVLAEYIDKKLRY